MSNKGLIGAGIGVGIGMLVSKKTGKENQEELKRKLNDLVIKAKSVDSKELINAIDRSSFIKSDGKNIVKLSISSKGIDLNSSNQMGSSFDQISVISYEGNPLEISCSGKYLIDAIRAIDCENVLIKFSGELKPIIITDESDDSLIQLISPVRTYSSGQYMRLAFSVAINVDAEILLIDDGAFDGENSIAHITLNEGLLRIGSRAFSSRLEGITIPASVRFIDGVLQENSQSTFQLAVDAANTHYKCVDNMLMSMDGDTLLMIVGASGHVTIPNGVTVLGTSVADRCS